jgi:hypothetical protein
MTMVNHPNRSKKNKKPLESKILKMARNIHELEESLERIACDDNKQVSDYSDAEILSEAKYVLGLFFEGGHSLNDMLSGEYGEDDKAFAEKQVRQLKKLLALK